MQGRAKSVRTVTSRTPSNTKMRRRGTTTPPAAKSQKNIRIRSKRKSQCKL